MLSQEALIAQQLNEAAGDGDVARVKDMLPALGDEQAQWLRGAFMRAVYENQVRVVYVLLEAGASLDSTDDLGQTSLHWAARRGYEGLARMLLNRKAPVGCKNPDGVTPLHLAVEHNLGPVVQLLLQHGADPCVTTQDGRTSLHVAADCGSSVAVAVLLDASLEGSATPSASSRVLLEVETNRGETAMVRAAARGKATVVQLLLRSKGNPEHRNLWGQTALFLSALGGHVASAAVLLDAGAKVNSTAGDGASPLHTAVDRGHPQVVELLLSHHGDHRARAKGGRTPLHTAADRGCLEAAEALLASGAEVDAHAEEGRTPLCCAATRGHAAVALKLLEAGADAQGLDVLRQTPLHAAAATGKVKVADLLISRRVKTEQEDAAGRTPMLIALAFKQDAMVRLLLKRGGVLPEDVASLPEMQPLIHEVENELLQEQLSEVAAGKLKEQMKEAERDFEDARQRMLGLCTRTCAASTAPVISHHESLLSAAKEQVRAKQMAERRLVDQVKTAQRSLVEASAELKAQLKAQESLRKSIDEMKKGKGPKEEELSRLTKEIADTKRQDAAAVEQEARLAAMRQDALGKIAALREKLQGVNDQGSQLASRLEEVQEELDKWNAQKEEAVELHAKAQALLNRNGSSPSRPGSSIKT